MDRDMHSNMGFKKCFGNGGCVNSLDDVVVFNRSIRENVKLGYEGADCWAMTPLDDTPDPVTIASPWVLDKIEEVNRVMGISFEGMEEESWVFFSSFRLS